MATPSNPSPFPTRYSIRPLRTPQHAEWAKAIVMHSNMFHNPAWPLLYPHNKTRRTLSGMAAASYLIDHQIASGLSFGVFDTEYVFKRPESVKTGGALYWDEIPLEDGSEEEADDATASAALLSRMDFPLASVALAYDGFHALDMAQMEPLLAVLPLFGTIYHELELRDARKPETWRPTGPGQVLLRNATSTRPDYEGLGLMGGLARWLMREAKGRGFRGVQIECVNDAVHHVWSQPPGEFKGEVVSLLDMGTYEGEGGERVFKPATQVCSKVYVTL